MRPTGRTRNAIYSTYSYDVWGNEEDGYEVNDVFCLSRAVEFTQEEYVANEGTPLEFRYWEIPKGEIKDYFNLSEEMTIESLGEDDDMLYIDDENGKPIGEIRFERFTEEKS